MAYAARLCNPTPWPVEFNYELGVQIVVPGFGETNLTMAQMDDFRPDKPGAENVQEELETLGVFLFDTDKSYESQALNAIRASRRRRNEIYNTTTRHHQEQAARQGIKLDDVMYDEILRQMGLKQLKAKVDKLDELITEYEAVVNEESTEKRRRQLDPARTVFALDVPREFPSVIARDFFLKENPDVAAKEKEFRAQWEEAENG